MNKIDETVELLHQKIDECDELIVEISQLRYRLDTILDIIDKKPDKPTSPRRHEKQAC